MHNKVRIQTIKVKTDHPIILSRNRFFDICTCILRILYQNVPWEESQYSFFEIIVNDRIPHTNLKEHIIIVYFGVICHSNRKFNQFHLVFHTVNKFHVNDVIFYKFLPPVSIEILERIKLRVIKFFLSKFNTGNIIQTIGFLCFISELLIKIQVIKLSDTTNIIRNVSFFLHDKSHVLSRVPMVTVSSSSFSPKYDQYDVPNKAYHIVHCSNQ